MKPPEAWADVVRIVTDC